MTGRSHSKGEVFQYRQKIVKIRYGFFYSHQDPDMRKDANLRTQFADIFWQNVDIFIKIKKICNKMVVLSHQQLWTFEFLNSSLWILFAFSHVCQDLLDKLLDEPSQTKHILLISLKPFKEGPIIYNGAFVRLAPIPKLKF